MENQPIMFRPAQKTPHNCFIQTKKRKKRNPEEIILSKSDKLGLAFDSCILTAVFKYF